MKISVHGFFVIALIAFIFSESHCDFALENLDEQAFEIGESPKTQSSSDTQRWNCPNQQNEFEYVRG